MMPPDSGQRDAPLLPNRDRKNGFRRRVSPWPGISARLGIWTEDQFLDNVNKNTKAGERKHLAKAGEISFHKSKEFVIPSAARNLPIIEVQAKGDSSLALGMTRVKPARRSTNGRIASALFTRISCGRLGARHGGSGSVGTEPVCLEAVSGSGPDMCFLQLIPNQPDLD